MRFEILTIISLRGRLRTHTVFTKDQFFLSQLLLNLHKIIGRRCVFESLRLKLFSYQYQYH